MDINQLFNSISKIPIQSYNSQGVSLRDYEPPEKYRSQLESFELKTSRDQINFQLEAFLQNLSSEEIKQFNEKKDYSELIKSIKTLNINDSKLNNYKDIKQIEDHIIESMIKRFFSNA